MNTSLHDVKPIYTAIFTFADAAGDLRLSISWHEVHHDKGTTYDLESNSGKWTRLDRDTGAETSLFDASLMDLSSSLAWQVDILAAQPVEESRLPPALKKFAHSVKFDSTAIGMHDANRPFVRYGTAPNLKSIRQRIAYCYSISNTDFTLELSRRQERAFRGRLAESIVSEPRWCLEVYRNEWDSWFGQNARLAIGEGTEWCDESDSWFPKDIGPGVPDDGDGFLQLMEKLNTIEALIKDPKKPEVVDLITGMCIG